MLFGEKVKNKQAGLDLTLSVPGLRRGAAGLGSASRPQPAALSAEREGVRAAPSAPRSGPRAHQLVSKKSSWFPGPFPAAPGPLALDVLSGALGRTGSVPGHTSITSHRVLVTEILLFRGPDRPLRVTLPQRCHSSAAEWQNPAGNWISFSRALKLCRRECLLQREAAPRAPLA